MSTNNENPDHFGKRVTPSIDDDPDKTHRFDKHLHCFLPYQHRYLGMIKQQRNKLQHARLTAAASHNPALHLATSPRPSPAHSVPSIWAFHIVSAFKLADHRSENRRTPSPLYPHTEPYHTAYPHYHFTPLWKSQMQTRFGPDALCRSRR
ncbi:hypothetical protein SNOG_00023 [Parastagonospora nodorum SN15]|uniref:Uncharacterized protein n=1 Tax=Phaeosphaeria nodorum (strain SN15 / ATCC MYA-4574 / FGSC 10173) TaxID=321614 RepID=Q0V7J1_PHANO|nr:hypothetical protein SNOG_00023 [Parastagonospora nodorum SN15]EAT91518.1 hypothetical protein SNOG_00023 [Parastagonospora nodorum SN15]